MTDIDKYVAVPLDDEPWKDDEGGETRMSKWIASGSVVMQTEEYRFDTGGIELVLTRTPTGAWKLACAQLWSNGESRVIAPSSETIEQAQYMALIVAHNRIGELGQALPRAR